MSVTWKIECTDGKKDAVTLGLGKTVIGRGHLLQIRELKVSRHHAELQITDKDELILKAMHPGLPCFYKKKDAETQSELVRGATIQLDQGDVFSLHSNPDCEFKVICSTADNNGTVESPGGGGEPVSMVKDDDEKKAKDKEIDDDDQQKEDNEEEEEDLDEKPAESEDKEEDDDDGGSDWSDSKTKKSRTSRTKIPRKKAKSRTPRNARKPPAKKRKAMSSEEGEDKSEEDSDSDNAGRRGRRQPARIQPRLPPRRTTKPVTYNEDLLLDGMTPSEASEQESEDGLPKIGRQKKPDSDSDFKMDEDSGSDWDERKSSKKGDRRSGPPPKITPSRRGGRKKRRGSDSELSDEEEEYIPRLSRRRSAPSAAAKERTKCKYGKECYRKNSEHTAEFIHPGDSDWSDSSQGEEDEKGSGKESEEESE